MTTTTQSPIATDNTLLENMEIPLQTLKRPLLDQDQLIFYDIEIFKHDAMVVFKDINYNVLAVFHNNFEGLLQLVTNKTLVGYNNYFYDDKVVSKMINHWTPNQLKEFNDRLIGGETIKQVNKSVVSLDCFQEIDVSRPSLKKVEANMGWMIKETDIPFDIDRQLTDEEMVQTLQYCSYDVDRTIDIYKMRIKSYFEPKLQILGMKNSLPDFAYRWNNTTIIANVLVDKPFTKWSGIRVPDELLDLVPDDVRNMWIEKEKGTKTTKEFDNEIQWGFGGLHSQIVGKKVFRKVHNLDFASLYPSLICNYDIYGQATELYNTIRETRIRIKHSEPKRQLALKLILNMSYGLLKNKYSMLFNPKASTTVCALGQSILYDLTSRLAQSCTIIQSNTDGVAFIPHNDDYKNVWKEIEDTYEMTLEEDIFDLFIQRDVNNYIAVESDGSVKVKGGDVNNYSSDTPFKTNNTRIVDIAIVENLVNGADVIDTIQNNLDKPHLFQYVLKPGGTYKGTCDQDGNLLDTKVNRVFASRETGLTLYKLRKDGGQVRFPDAPLNMLLWNEDTNDFENFDKQVDINFYYQLIMRKLESWKETV